MAWYPNAVQMELQPESNDQPVIRPTQFIVHSVIAPWTAARIYQYWDESSSLESHFGLGYDGDLGQYIGTETRADANAQANRRADGTGAVSIETASNTKGTDPWTDAQVEQLIRLGVWLHQRHGIPLRICRSWTDPGFGYHRLFPEWSTSGTSCPGDARVTQFKTAVFPGIVARATGTTPEGEDMPTAEEVARAVWGFKLTSPTAAEGTDPLREAGTFLRWSDARQAKLLAELGALRGAVTELTTAVGSAGGITAEQVQAAATAGAQAALEQLGDALTEGN